MNILETMAQRATGLYSLPEVAVQVLELTDDAKVDARALKECIERDPALVVKVLKVVNSSLFGLQSEVVDLNQALALLGSNTLKLLVLGFSLPDALFAEVAAEQLSRYWTSALTRAVAARELAQIVTKQNGGEAFIAGLLQDVGQLVLLKELGEPYAKLLDGVWKEQSDLKTVERAAVGFDHRQLTCTLLKQWGLPQSISNAIDAKRNAAGRVSADQPNGTLAQVIHLTELVVELVARNRLAVLPLLLETGEAYFGMTREQLEEIILRIEPNVVSLADGLSVQLNNDLDFNEVIAKAHRQLSAAAEEASIPVAKWEAAEEAGETALLQEIETLADASRAFLNPASQKIAKQNTKNLRFHAAKKKEKFDSSSDRTPQERQMQTLVAVLETALSNARAKRESISLLLLRATPNQEPLNGCLGSELLARVLDSLETEGALPAPSVGLYAASILPAHDRNQAVRVVKHILRQTAPVTASGEASREATATVCAGIAALSIVSKNFDPKKLVEAAERCLYAAEQSGTGGAKSIELY